jgi:hypothetical protein
MPRDVQGTEEKKETAAITNVTATKKKIKNF